MNELLQADPDAGRQVDEICTAAGSIIAIIVAVIRARRAARRKRRTKRKAGN